MTFPLLSLHAKLFSPMNLIFLRHGKAEDLSPSGRDEDRSLTPEGVAELESVLPVASRMLPQVTRILSSPYARARQTAAIAQTLLAPGVGIEICAQLRQESSPAEFLDFLADNSAETVLAVTHQPFVSRCISIFVTGRESAEVSVPRGGICWVELQNEKGRLRSLLRPEQLKGLLR